MKTMRTFDIMRRDVAYCTLDATLATVGKTMAEAECGFLPVVDAGRVVGVITDRDLALKLVRRDGKPSTMHAWEAMTAEVVVGSSDEPVIAALERMRERGVRRLPVVTADRRLEGVLSLDDVAIAARAIEEQGSGVPPYLEIARTLQGICVAQAAPARMAQ